MKIFGTTLNVEEAAAALIVAVFATACAKETSAGLTANEHSASNYATTGSYYLQPDAAENIVATNKNRHGSSPTWIGGDDATVRGVPDPNRVIVTFKDESFYNAALRANRRLRRSTTVTGTEEYKSNYSIDKTMNTTDWAVLLSARTTKLHLQFDRSAAFAATMSPQAANALKNDPRVLMVERDPVRYLGGSSSSMGSLRKPPENANATVTTTSAIAMPASSLRLNTNMNMNSSTSRRHHRRRLRQQIVPYGIKMVQADKLTYQGGKTVCIMDTGYNFGHEDLPTASTSTAANGKQQKQKVNGYNGKLPWQVDGHGHGTHVAGIVAAEDNLRGVVGVAPGVNLYVVRMFGDDGGWAYESDVVHAVERCVQQGKADVVNMSFGGTDGTRFGRRELQRIYRESGVLLVAAAMNSGGEYYFYPASYNSVVSAAAVDRKKRPAPFSQRNDQVELAAPGVSILSTVPYPVVEGSVTLSNDYPLRGTKSFLDSSPGDVTGPLVDCERGEAAGCLNGNNKVCIIRGHAMSTGEHFSNCQKGGGIAAIFYNFNSHQACKDHQRLGRSTHLPTACVEKSSRARILKRAAWNGLSGRVVVRQTSYRYTEMDGTSMAAPYVASVAALVWSNHPNCTNREIRRALVATALAKQRQRQAIHPGTTKRDNAIGFGIVKAKRASNFLKRFKCRQH